MQDSRTPRRLNRHVHASGSAVRVGGSERLALRAAGCPELDPVLCLTEDERITVCACARVAAPPEARKLRSGRAAGGTFAWLTHRGAYEELGLAYHALHAWVQERGHEPQGPMREVYLNDPAQVPPEQLVTVVLLPIAGA